MDGTIGLRTVFIRPHPVTLVPGPDGLRLAKQLVEADDRPCVELPIADRQRYQEPFPWMRQKRVLTPSALSASVVQKPASTEVNSVGIVVARGWAASFRMPPSRAVALFWPFSEKPCHSVAERFRHPMPDLVFDSIRVGRTLIE